MGGLGWRMKIMDSNTKFKNIKLALHPLSIYSIIFEFAVLELVFNLLPLNWIESIIRDQSNQRPNWRREATGAYLPSVVCYMLYVVCYMLYVVCCMLYAAPYSPDLLQLYSYLHLKLNIYSASITIPNSWCRCLYHVLHLGILLILLMLHCPAEEEDMKRAQFQFQFQFQFQSY